MRRCRTAAAAAAFAALALVACDESNELQDIEPGRDQRPAIDASPPDEVN